MPTEASFLDRYGRALSLKNFCAGFTPTFAPSDPTVSVVNFTLFLNQVDAANDAAKLAEDNYTTVATERETQLKEMKLTATRVLNYLKSNAVFAARLVGAKQAADKLRGVNTRRPKPTAAPGSPAAKQVRSRGDMSYMDAQGHFKSLINSVTGIAAYAPTPVANPITLVNLNATFISYRDKNTTLSTLDSTYTDAVAERARFYEGATGLQGKFKTIKNAVAAQYGRTSTEYQTVKGINY